VNPRVTTSTDLADLEDALDRWGKLSEPVKEKRDDHVLKAPEKSRSPWSRPVNYLGGPEFARWDES
jgi:hypothetical protein